MNASDYAVYYDLAQEPFSPWTELLFIAIGILIGFFALAEQRTGKFVMLGFSAIWILFSGADGVIEWSNYQSLRAQLAAGHVSDVEGHVTDFAGGGWKAPEIFTLANHTFTFYASDEGPGFHQTVVAGGPNLSRQCVRALIANSPNGLEYIVWLGIRVRGPCADDAR